ncbi:MAG: hypothetical protein ACR2NF_10985, partial [Pirellulales bacterium]
KDLREDVDENTQGISDNAQAISDLADVVEINSTDIEGIQTQIDKLPPPTDIGDLEQDVDGLAKSVGTNTIAIAKNTADIAALPEMTIDLDPLNDSIADNAAGINQNAKDIVSLKATDATLTGKVNDLEAAVGHLEAIDLPDNYAVVDDDNQFQTPQTIKDGVKLTGSAAYIECDTGTPLQVKNGNFSNSVVDIVRSNGSVAISLEASGHIRGVKTDAADPTSAVNVEFVQDLVGDNQHTHDTYATKVELKTEEQARILGDQALDAKIDALEPYNDTKIKQDLAKETDERKAADSALNDKIDNLDLGDGLPDGLVDEDRLTEALEDYATETFVNDAIADFATENFVEDAIGAIEFPDLPEGLATETYVDEAIDALSASGGYNDAWIQPAIDAGDATSLAGAKAYTDQEIAAIPLSDYATKQESTDGDSKALNDANDYTDAQIAAADYLPTSGGTVTGDLFVNKPNNQPIFTITADKVELQKHAVNITQLSPKEIINVGILDNLMRDPGQYGYLKDYLPLAGGKVDGLLAVTYSDAPFDNTYTFNVQGSRMPEEANSAFRVTASGSVKAGHDASTPFMAVAQNDVVTRGFLEGLVGNLDIGDGSTLDDYAKTDFVLDELSTKLSNSGNTSVVQDWRVRSPKGEGSQTYIKIADDKLHLYHVADPTNDEHGVSRGYADQRYQVIQEPLVIQTTHSMECVTLNTPGSKQFCGLYNTSPGSSTNANMYFGNWNAGMRVALDCMKTSDGAEFAQNQKYVFNGYVNVVGKEDGRLYFKQAVDMIQRSGTDSYLTIHFSSRVATYATDQNDSQDKFVVTIEGYINKQFATLNLPDEEVD